jgi:DNA-binding transcriptional ArsR family regulator
LAGCAGKVPIHALALSNHGTSASVSARTAGGTEVAERQGLFPPAIHKHIRVLEGAGMVRRHKTGRTTYVALRREPLGLLQAWVGQLHPEWGTDQESLVNTPTTSSAVPPSRRSPQEQVRPPRPLAGMTADHQASVVAVRGAVAA